MGLSAGMRLGPYEIVAPLGAGGMGEVYRARDIRLERNVAIKVLPDDVAKDAHALSRFEHEAKAVAALSHPNILALFDVGKEGAVSFVVMELLEGETLREALAKGPLSLRKALDVGLQVAEGLAAAHGKGIVHRDVKPENVFLTKDGHAKLLDFGLARSGPASTAGDETHSPTLDKLTSGGAVLGTVAYMSPEQARGEAVDFRSDQFSLGIVLYEMLTGKRPFGGASAAETLTAIIREEPEPLDKLAPRTPAPVRWISDRLLAKDPRGRYDATSDLARDVRMCSLHLSETGEARGAATRAGAGKRSWRSLPMSYAVGAVAALAVLCALAGAFVAKTVRTRTVPEHPPVNRVEIRLPKGYYLSMYRQPFALSPDGRLIVFSAFTWKKPFEEQNEPQLFLRPLDSYEAKPIPGTEGGFQPVFSPDGRHVAFSVESESGTFLKRIPLAGGQVMTICKCEALYGAAWSPEGTILFAAQLGPLQKVPETGGTPEWATTLDVKENEVSHRLPHLLPDGRTVLYTAMRWDSWERHWRTARIFAQRLGEKERSLLATNGSDGRWAADHLIFAREGRLFAAAFDAVTLRLTGKPVPILEGVSHAIWTGNTGVETGAAMLDLSGRLFAWIPGSVMPEHQNSLVWVDASGKETPLDIPKGPFLGGRVSPDGNRVLVQYIYSGKQVELLELSRGSRRNLTFGLDPLWAIWGPGPDRITFNSYHEGSMGIYSRRIDAGSEEVETLLRPSGSGGFQAVGSWSRDGKTLAFSREVWEGDKNYGNIWLLERGKQPRPVAPSRFSEYQPDISPDGRWLLFTSDEPGRPEVFVRQLSSGGAPRQVSVGGGVAPLWSRDGKAIFYWSLWQGSDRRVLFRVRVSGAGTGLSFGRPERLLEVPVFLSSPGHTWDVAPDGRFLIVKLPDEADRRAWWEKVLSDRIRIDLDGLPALLSETGKKP